MVVVVVVVEEGGANVPLPLTYSVFVECGVRLAGSLACGGSGRARGGGGGGDEEGGLVGVEKDGVGRGRRSNTHSWAMLLSTYLTV